ncbi:MAG: branched-chain amino acid ABC transporter permease [Thermodesulfobacteriota bacterium]
MNLVLVGQAMIGGLIMGSVYALLGAGFSLAWGVMRVVHISHPAFGLLAAYLAYWLLKATGLDPLLSLFFSAPLFFMLGLLVYRWLIQPITRARETMVASMIVFVGLSIILENVIMLIWSPDPRLLKPAYSGQVYILGPFYFQAPHLLAFGLAALGITGLHLFLRHTLTGKAVRAAWQQPEAAQIHGIRLSYISALTFGLALATAALGGVALAFLYTFDPYAHNLWLVYLFLVVIVGGVGNLLGSALAGLLIGLITGLSLAFVPYHWVNLIVFGLLMLVLLFRPQGLFGQGK